MLNKLVLRALLSLSLAFSFAGTATADLITQDFISDLNGDIIGSITINTDPSEVADFGLRDVFSFEEFNFFGLDMLAPGVADANQFYASFDAADYSLGLQDLVFDLTDVLGLYAWNGEYFFGAGAVDAFALSGTPDPEFALYSAFTLGEATVVSTPATLVLFLTAVAGLASRRRKN
jgi:hypothetical protein